MPLRIVVSPSAKADLLDLWLWIAEDSTSAADRVLDRVQTAITKLADLPRMGRSRDELRAGLRSFVVDSHVVFYTVRREQLEVVRILHGRRDLGEAF